MDKRNIIVIGASAGGFDAIQKIVAGLPPGFDASIFIVWHMSPDVRGILPEVLNRLQTLPAAHAIDMEPLKTQHIYVAPPDHHLLLEKGRVRISKGPKENRFRPAVDPLFRSAAYVYGSRVIGVILSGALDDGSAGLWMIQQNGGITVVQDPNDAEVPSMPQSALRAVNVDYQVPVLDIPDLLIKLAAEYPDHDLKEANTKQIEAEVRIAMEQEPLQYDFLAFGELTPYTCPECHGVLTSIKEGDNMRFRCHTGHAFSASSLLAAIGESIEETLWSAVRNVQESVLLLNHMGDHFAERDQPKLAAMYFKKGKDAETRANEVRQAVLSHEHLSLGNISQQADSQ